VNGSRSEIYLINLSNGDQIAGGARSSLGKHLRRAFVSCGAGGLSGEIIDRERRDTTFKSILKYLRPLLQINSDDFILGFLQNDSKGLTWIFNFLQLFGSEEESIVVNHSDMPLVDRGLPCVSVVFGQTMREPLPE
jgi:hypothetical protein